MTRDEAIEVLVKRPGWSRQIAVDWVSDFVALGMLKLDEPKSARTKTLDALFKHFGASDIESIIGLLDEAGLKIIEK